MRFLKFLLLWFTCFVTLFISWTVGTVLGNILTNSSPPELNDPAALFQAFLGVCALCGLLLAALIWFTRHLSGRIRWASLVVFPFGIQFLLSQMETWFFSSSIGITNRQILSIIVTGFVVSVVTMALGIWLTRVLSKGVQRKEFALRLGSRKNILPLLVIMVLIVYPMLYLMFGYFVAWQNEELRIFYSGSSAIAPFLSQLKAWFTDGIYFFQIARALIWIALTLPIIMMLRTNPVLCYVLGALLTALLPSVLLFIPNPYMPYGIAMSHFVETFGSNLVWGLAMVWVVNQWSPDQAKQVVAEAG